MSTRDEFEQAILENPDDLQRWLVYADWLEEQGDPRGELMHAQIALEDESRTPEERDKIREKEQAIIDQHLPGLLGAFAERLTAEPTYSWRPRPSYRFERGILHAVTFPEFGASDAAALKEWRHLPFLRELEVHSQDWEDEGGHEDLIHVDLSRLTRFVHGDPADQCHTSGEHIHELVTKMPALTHLGCYSHRVDSDQLFAAELPHLKALSVYHIHEYPVEVLARNPTLSGLETLDLFPHALEYDDEPYLAIEDVRALTGKNSTLTGLKHLTLQLCTAGDEGVEALVAWPGFKKLKTLDLVYGEITDEGAKRLAEAGVDHLDRLNLSGNSLTEAGVALLQEAGAKALNVNEQVQWGEEREYLWYGDME